MQRSKPAVLARLPPGAFHGFAAIAAAWVASLAPAFGGAAGGLEFQLIDQFGDERTQDDVADQVTILIGGNRKASEHSRDWALAIKSLLERRTDQDEEIAVLRIADLRGIPRILEPAVATQLSMQLRKSGTHRNKQGAIVEVQHAVKKYPTHMNCFSMTHD